MHIVAACHVLRHQTISEHCFGVSKAIPNFLPCLPPLALLMGQLAAPRPIGTLLLDRGLETLIGVVIGIGVGAVTRRRQRPAAATG